MVKRLTYIGGAGLVLMALLFGWDALSYVGTSADWVKESVKEGVPVEFEIERARKMVASLGPEIRRNMHLIAKEEVEVERLSRQVERLQSAVEKGRSDLVRMQSDLKSGQQVFYYAGRRYTGDQVRINLANRLKRTKTNDESLVSLTKVLNAREHSLSAARQKLEQMLAAKKQLIADVESAEARHKLVEVAQTASDFQFDDSRLARTKQLINDIQTRIEVEERLVDVEIDYHDEIPLEETDTDTDIVEQVASYLGNIFPEVQTVAFDAE